MATVMCLVKGDNNPFAVEVPHPVHVSQLKPALWRENPSLQKIDSKDFTLWKINERIAITPAKTIWERIEALDLTRVLSKLEEPAQCITAMFSESALSLDFLHILVQVHTPGISPSGSGSSQSDADPMLLKSFHEDYKGVGLLGFREYLTRNNKEFSRSDSDKTYYGKFCSIVQSSGTGKSRLMIELGAKGVMVLYINIRDEVSVGYPLRDDIPATLLKAQPNLSEEYYEAQVCAFFAATFESIGDTLKTISVNKSFEEIADIWHQTIGREDGPGRENFFRTLKNKHVKIMKRVAPLNNNDAMLVDHVGDIMENVDVDGELSRSRIRKPTLCGEDEMTRAYNKLMANYPGIFTQNSDHRPRLVIGVDEAHTLRPIVNNWRPSIVVCRAISAYSCYDALTHSVWVAFASTNSQIADFAAPSEVYESLRVAQGGELLFPPYTDLGWDHKATTFGTVQLRNVSDFHHICGFGRPLWRSLEAADGGVKLMSIARLKLCKAKRFTPTNHNQSLAVLGQRFSIGVSFGNKDAVGFLETAVAGHMKYCHATTDDRTWQYTSYPSEPFLSNAAAQLLHDTPEALTPALNCLSRKVSSGLINVGAVGELHCRLLLLLCKDILLQDRVEELGEDKLLYCERVGVIQYLEFLFGSKVWPANKEEKDAALRAFEHAYINFSHWIAMEENIASPDRQEWSSDSWILRLLSRTSAVQCCHGQPLIDNVIPIYFDEGTGEDLRPGADMPADHPDEGTGDLRPGADMLAHHPDAAHSKPEPVSEMLISAKATVDENPRDVNYIQRTHDSISCANGRPYVAITLDLGSKRHTVESHFPVKSSTSHDSDNKLALRIYASGHGHETFPFLDKREGLSREMDKIFLTTKSQVPLTDSPNRKKLRDAAKFGWTSKDENMAWGSAMKGKLE